MPVKNFPMKSSQENGNTYEIKGANLSTLMEIFVLVANSNPCVYRACISISVTPSSTLMVREPCPLHQPQLVCPCPSSRGIVKLLIGRREGGDWDYFHSLAVRRDYHLDHFHN